MIDYRTYTKVPADKKSSYAALVLSSSLSTVPGLTEQRNITVQSMSETVRSEEFRECRREQGVVFHPVRFPADVPVAQQDPPADRKEVRKFPERPRFLVSSRFHFDGGDPSALHHEIDLHHAGIASFAVIPRRYAVLRETFRNHVLVHRPVVCGRVTVEETSGVVVTVHMHEKTGIGKVDLELGTDLVRRQRGNGTFQQAAEVTIAGVFDPKKVLGITVRRLAAPLTQYAGIHELPVALDQLSRDRLETFGRLLASAPEL